MHDLIAITALGGTEPRVDVVGARTCTELSNLALASVTARMGREADCAAALARVLGTDGPGPGKAVLSTPYSAVWTGPAQWMLGADFATHEDIAAQLKTAVGDSASVSEQTDAWAGFDLTGDRVHSVLELLCNVNLNSVEAGDATRSSIHHLGCFLICGERDRFWRIIGPRASAGSLHHAIVTAMKAVA